MCHARELCFYIVGEREPSEFWAEQGWDWTWVFIRRRKYALYLNPRSLWASQVTLVSFWLCSWCYFLWRYKVQILIEMWALHIYIVPFISELVYRTLLNFTLTRCGKLGSNSLKDRPQINWHLLRNLPQLLFSWSDHCLWRDRKV